MSSLEVPSLQKPKYGSLDFRRWTQRTASLVSGVGLALMAVLMMAGYFGGVVPLVTAGDAERTAADISRSPALFLGGVACIFVVTLLDIVVAAAWYALFKPANRTLSAVAAWIRAIFAGLFMVAAGHLVSALSLLGQPERALLAIQRFESMWLIILGLFGIHLLLIGYLAVRSGFMARIFGILLAIAGLGYIADAVGTVISADLPVAFGSVGFVGEVVIIFWLLIQGRRLVD